MLRKGDDGSTMCLRCQSFKMVHTSVKSFFPGVNDCRVMLSLSVGRELAEVRGMLG